MSLLTKQEFAAKTGLATKHITTYADRKKIEIGSDGLIDTSLEKNRLFYNSQIAKGKVTTDGVKPVVQKSAKDPAPKPTWDKFDEDEEFDEVDEDGLMSLTKADRLLQHNKALGAQKRVELAQLEIDKQMGLLVSFEAVKTLFAGHSRALTNSFKNVLENMLSLISAKYLLTNQENADLRKEALNAINRANDDAIEETKRGLKVLLEQFTEANKLKA